MLSIFKKETVPAKKNKKPLSLQITYSFAGNNNALFNHNDSQLTTSLLQHLAITHPLREKFSLEAGTTLIGFSKKSSDLVLVFPEHVQRDAKLWHQLIQFADKHHLNIGELRVAKSTDAQRLTKNGQSMYLVSPTALNPCTKLYPKFIQERTNTKLSSPAL